MVPVSVEVGDGLAVEVADAGGAGPLLEREVPPLRDALFLDLGVALPGLRARANPQLAPREARIALQEVPALSLTLPEGRHLALAAADELPSLGVEAGTAATDPDDGGPAAWVRPEDTEALGAAGIPVLDAAAVVARALGAAVRRRASSLLGLQETQAMLDQLERAYPALVRHVVPKPVSLALLADVLRRLVDEGVSVRPLREILEALAVHAPRERDPVALTEHVRAGLKRQITHRFAEGGALDVFLVDPAIEDAIRDGVQRTATGSYLALAPDLSREIIGAVKAEAEHALPGLPFVLVTQADVRRFLRRLVEVDVPDAVVLSFQELAPDVRLEPEPETHDAILHTSKGPAAALLPCSLPEWRVEREEGALTRDQDHRLRMLTIGQGRNLASLLWIDLSAKRFAKQRTWRRLSVAQSLKKVARDVAVGFRMQSGKEQWLYYRSLDPPANRTVLGQNLSSEAFVGRFLPTGEVDEYFEIEADAPGVGSEETRSEGPTARHVESDSRPRHADGRDGFAQRLSGRLRSGR